MNRKIARGTFFLIGLSVKADHPVTPLNPSETFEIYETKFERESLYVRGKDTMWFRGDLIRRV